MSSSISAGAPRITLDGTDYMLDIPQSAQGGEAYYVRYPQRSQPSQSDEEDFWADWTIRSFHGGERLKKILDENDLNSFRYDDAEGLDQALLAKWGELKLCSSITRSDTIQSANMPMAVSADGTLLVVGLAVSPFIMTWDNTNGWVDYSTGTIANSGAITDLICAGTVYYAVRGGTVLTCTGAPATANWTAVGAYTTAVGVAVVNSELYVAKSDGVYNQTTSETISSEPCTAIAGYNENIYFGKDRRIFRYDGRAAYLFDELPQGFILTALLPYRNILFVLGYFKIRTGYKASVYYITSSSENHLYTLGDYSADHRIYALAMGDDEVFFANPKRGGADRYDLEVGGLTNGPIWGSAGAIPFKGMAVCEGYLFIGRYDNAAGTDGIWRADIQNPTAWKTTGWLTSPEFDFGWPNDTKLFKDILFECRALATGESIKIEYSLDGGSTYTTADTISYADDGAATKATITLDNISGVSIKLRITPTGPGTSTPTLTKVVVRAARCIESTDMWDLRLFIANDDTKVTALETSYAKRTQLSFTDLDRTTTHNVIIEELAMAAMPDKTDKSMRVRMRLREV